MIVTFETMNNYGEITKSKELVTALEIADGYVYMHTVSKTGRVKLKDLVRLEVED